MSTKKSKQLPISVTLSFVGLIVSLAITIIYASINTPVNKGDVLVNDGYFKDNTWFYGYVKILNHDGDTYVVSHDDLNLKINYTNKHSEPIKVQMILSYPEQERISVKKLPIIILNDSKTFTQNTSFQLTSEGQNIIKLDAEILELNATNDKSPINVISTQMNLPVYSQLNKLQDQSNKINRTAMFISASVAVITLVSLIATSVISYTHRKTLEEQNKILRDQAIEQNRPWIGRENRPDNIMLTPRDIVNPPFLKFHMYNFGHSPAIDITTQVYVNSSPPSANPFDSVTLGNKFAIVPQERWTNRFPITDQEFNLAKTGILYYGIRIVYTDKNGTEGLYELQGHYDHNYDTFDKMDIK